MAPAGERPALSPGDAMRLARLREIEAMLSSKHRGPIPLHLTRSRRSATPPRAPTAPAAGPGRGSSAAERRSGVRPSPLPPARVLSPAVSPHSLALRVRAGLAKIRSAAKRAGKLSTLNALATQEGLAAFERQLRIRAHADIQRKFNRIQLAAHKGARHASFPRREIETQTDDAAEGGERAVGGRDWTRTMLACDEQALENLAEADLAYLEMVRTKSGLHHQTAGALVTSEAEQALAESWQQLIMLRLKSQKLQLHQQAFPMSSDEMAAIEADIMRETSRIASSLQKQLQNLNGMRAVDTAVATSSTLKGAALAADSDSANAAALPRQASAGTNLPAGASTEPSPSSTANARHSAAISGATNRKLRSVGMHDSRQLTPLIRGSKGNVPSSTRPRAVRQPHSSRAVNGQRANTTHARTHTPVSRSSSGSSGKSASGLAAHSGGAKNGHLGVQVKAQNPRASLADSGHSARRAPMAHTRIGGGVQAQRRPRSAPPAARRPKPAARAPPLPSVSRRRAAAAAAAAVREVFSPGQRCGSGLGCACDNNVDGARSSNDGGDMLRHMSANAGITTDFCAKVVENAESRLRAEDENLSRLGPQVRKLHLTGTPGANTTDEELRGLHAALSQSHSWLATLQHELALLGYHPNGNAASTPVAISSEAPLAHEPGRAATYGCTGSQSGAQRSRGRSSEQQLAAGDGGVETIQPMRVEISYGAGGSPKTAAHGDTSGMPCDVADEPSGGEWPHSASRTLADEVEAEALRDDWKSFDLDEDTDVEEDLWVDEEFGDEGDDDDAGWLGCGSFGDRL